MINNIQIILASGLVFIGLYIYLKIRTSYLDSILLFGFLGGGLLMVFFPQKSNDLARFFGVGRGTDLIFYLSTLFFLFLIMKLYAKLRKLERITTELVRKLSLLEEDKTTRDR